jgi:hypothetical protein
MPPHLQAPSSVVTLSRPSQLPLTHGLPRLPWLAHSQHVPATACPAQAHPYVTIVCILQIQMDF